MPKLELTARQIAERIGVTVRTIQRRADNESWPYTERAATRARHPERLYDTEQLPDELRDKFLQPDLSSAETIDAIAQGATTEERRKAYNCAPEKHKSVAQQRVRAVELYLYLRKAGKSARAAANLAATELGASPRSVFRWVEAVKDQVANDWPGLLVPHWRNDSKPDDVHPEAWQALLDDFLRLEQPSFAACYRRLNDLAKQHPEWGAIPSRWSLQRRLNREVPQRTQDFRRLGRRAVEDKLPKQQRDKTQLVALQAVNADGHMLDVRCEWPYLVNGKPHISRPALIGWQDIYSGKMLAWTLDETENGDAVRIAFAQMIERYGIPDGARLDNGLAFMGKKMTGGMLGRHRFKITTREVDGIYRQFGIDARATLPYSGRSKPIERFFRDVCEEISRSPECAGAYVGSNVLSKPENYGSRAIPYDELVEIVNRKIEEMNARTGRRSETCRGRSFDETFFESLQARPFVRTATQQQIQWLMLPVEQVLVQRREAVVKVGKHRFFALELTELQGQMVNVRFNPFDVKAGCWVFVGRSLEPVCKADYQATVGYNDTKAAKATLRERRTLMRAISDEARTHGTQPKKTTKHARPKVVAVDFTKKPKVTPFEELPPERQQRILELQKEQNAEFRSVWQRALGDDQ